MFFKHVQICALYFILHEQDKYILFIFILYFYNKNETNLNLIIPIIYAGYLTILSIFNTLFIQTELNKNEF